MSSITMPASSFDLDAAARKIETNLLRAIASVGLRPIAEATDVDESTVTRWKEKDIPRFCKMVACLGFKMVPRHMRCHPPEYIAWLEAGNKLAAQSVTAEQQAEEDPE